MRKWEAVDRGRRLGRSRLPRPNSIRAIRKKVSRGKFIKKLTLTFELCVPRKHRRFEDRRAQRNYTAVAWRWIHNTWLFLQQLRIHSWCFGWSPHSSGPNWTWPPSPVYISESFSIHSSGEGKRWMRTVAARHRENDSDRRVWRGSQQCVCDKFPQVCYAIPFLSSFKAIKSVLAP